jgi:hypothetical protein
VAVCKFLDFGTTIVASHTTMWSSGLLTGSSINFLIWSQICMISNKTKVWMLGVLCMTPTNTVLQLRLLFVRFPTKAGHSWLQNRGQGDFWNYWTSYINIHQTSTDGHLTIPAVSQVAQKPGQRKRAKICKTQSIDSKTPRLT